MSGSRFAIIANMPPDVEYCQHDDHEDNHRIQAVEDGAKRTQVVAQLVASIGQYQAPGQRTQEGIEHKFRKRHS